MELECQLVANGLYCGDSSGYEDPGRMSLEKSDDHLQTIRALIEVYEITTDRSATLVQQCDECLSVPTLAANG